MKLSSIFAISLGAVTTLAAPKSVSGTGAFPRAVGPQSKPLTPSSGHLVGGTAGNYTSINWGGAVAAGQGFTYARGTLVVPRVELPPGGDPNGYYSAVAWVGIDGNACQSGLIQTGIQVTYDAGQRYYSAWYEWWPARKFNMSLAALVN